MFAQNLYPLGKGSFVTIDGGGIDILAPSTTGGWARGINFYDSGKTKTYFGFGLYGGAENAIRFYMGFSETATWNSATGINILANGNVGIGTFNPLAKLAVKGNIIANEIKVLTDIAVPDYVFDSDYDLMSLKEIENFISKHKHLPEIPSSKQVKIKGLDLAEMNLLLLKKIEELTLHLISKDKELNDVKKRITILEKRRL